MNRKYIGIALITSGSIAVFHELVAGAGDVFMIGLGVALLAIGYSQMRSRSSPRGLGGGE